MASFSLFSRGALAGRLWDFWIARLSRVTSNGRFIPCIDGLRFIALLSVVVYHLNGYLVAKASGFSTEEARATLGFELLHGAQCGVQVFFAISGFILALPFAREAFGQGRKVSLRRYFFRRVTRLEPPFLINLAVGVLLIVMMGKQTLSEMAAPLLATMTYTHNWIYGAMSTVNAVAWSLEIEVQFYLLAPFLARFYFQQSAPRRRLWLALCVGGLILAKTLFVVEGAVRFRLGLLYAFDHFLVGILIADIFVFKWREAPPQRKLFDVVGAVALPTIFFSQLNAATQHFLPIFTAMLFVAAIRGPLSNRILSFPLIVVTGGMCYTIYLYHFFVISLTGRFIVPQISEYSYLWQLLILSSLVLPVIFVVCSGLFIAIEKPFMKWHPGRKSESLVALKSSP